MDSGVINPHVVPAREEPEPDFEEWRRTVNNEKDELLHPLEMLKAVSAYRKSKRSAFEEYQMRFNEVLRMLLQKQRTDYFRSIATGVKTTTSEEQVKQWFDEMLPAQPEEDVEGAHEHVAGLNPKHYGSKW